MVSVPDGFEYPPEPQTLTERVAYAMCAREAFDGGSRFTEEELRALEAIVAAVQRTYGSRRALNQFLGFGGFDAFQKLGRLVADERHLATPAEEKGTVIFAAHRARADWPAYTREAAAAVSVLVEHPHATTPQEARDE